ncbi:DctQ TRAP-type C4-dicarboxylate transport system, large permease component [Burkholderiaceae bacterium]
MASDLSTIILFLIVSLTLILGAGVWIGVALMVIGYLGLSWFTAIPAANVLGTAIWTSLSSWNLAALPLFIWMGEILFRTRISENLFRGLAPWVNWLPGRLLHVNVIGCGIFAAVSGSSAATTATVGRMSLPELQKRGYDSGMSIASLAGSGTLGLLIPPSIIMIVYGVAAEVSIVRLFIAGVIPGVLLMILFSSYIVVWALINKNLAPMPEPSMPFFQRVKATAELIPIVLLILTIIASIYLGLATATEAAVVGVVGSLGISWMSKTLTWSSFKESIMGATRLSCMITLIIAGAAFLTSMMAYTGVPKSLATAVIDMDVNRYVLLAFLVVLYLILGCFIDGISMIVLTTAVVLPVIQAAGFDLIWFGIFIVILVEMAQITPPVGFNLFVLQGITKKNIFYIAKVSSPFFILMILLVALITVVPETVTWLPSKMLGR